MVPSYNDADMLAHCLAVLAAQIRPADEIIVVDNAITDDTPAVAEAVDAHPLIETVHGIWCRAAAASIDVDQLTVETGGLALVPLVRAFETRFRVSGE
ncbi:glycosyltransferase family A protein [Luethyella okanaganae]|uniref:Glycosyltransferase family A protein n=1 Tax=Luethyella okanaganae TaxID=69372 RepID=A0ABW1VL22_9MICO